MRGNSSWLSAKRVAEISRALCTEEENEAAFEEAIGLDDDSVFVEILCCVHCSGKGRADIQVHQLLEKIRNLLTKLANNGPSNGRNSDVGAKILYLLKYLLVKSDPYYTPIYVRQQIQKKWPRRP